MGLQHLVQEMVESVEQRGPSPVPYVNGEFVLSPEDVAEAKVSYATYLSSLGLVDVLPAVEDVLAWDYEADEFDSWKAKVLPNVYVSPNLGAYGGLVWYAYAESDAACATQLATGLFSNLTGMDAGVSGFISGVAVAIVLGRQMDTAQAAIDLHLLGRPDHGVVLDPAVSFNFTDRGLAHFTFGCEEVVLTLREKTASVRITLSAEAVESLEVMLGADIGSMACDYGEGILYTQVSAWIHTMIVADGSGLTVAVVSRHSDSYESGSVFEDMRRVLVRWLAYHAELLAWQDQLAVLQAAQAALV